MHVAQCTLTLKTISARFFLELYLTIKIGVEFSLQIGIRPFEIMTWIVQTTKSVYKLYCRVSLPCTIFDSGKKSCKWNYLCTNIWLTRADFFNYTTFDLFETFLRLSFFHFRFRRSRLIRKTDLWAVVRSFFNVDIFHPRSMKFF